MAGRCGGAPVAGAADALRHRSACRSELESYAGIGRPSPSLSARASRTEPPSAVTAHELLQHGTHCNLPTCCCSPAQQRSPCRAALVGPIGHFSRLQALRPLHSLTRTGQVNCHLINPHLWCTAVRVCTAPWASVRVAICCYVSPRSHLSQLRAPRSTHPRAQAR